VSGAEGTLLLVPIVTVATVVPVPVQPDPMNLVYVTVPLTPVDGLPPVSVAETVVELPTMIGETTDVVSVILLVTVTLAHVPVAALLFVSPP
jgi:hypothetical protein